MCHIIAVKCLPDVCSRPLSDGGEDASARIAAMLPVPSRRTGAEFRDDCQVLLRRALRMILSAHEACNALPVSGTAVRVPSCTTHSRS